MILWNHRSKCANLAFLARRIKDLFIMPPSPRWILERLDPEQHQVRSFRSGNSQVDGWLRQIAKHALSADTSITHVLAEPSARPKATRRRVLAYFSLAMAELDIHVIPEAERTGLPSGHQIPAALLTWLGIDQSLHGQGMGRTLLRLATLKVVSAADIIAAKFMVTDAIDARAKAFYEHFDFTPLPTQSHRLIISIDRLRRWLH